MPVVRVLVLALLFAGSLPFAAAAEPAARDLVSPDTALLVEINQPLQLIDNPLGRDVWGLIRETTGVKQALTSPQVDRFRQAPKLFEKSLGVDWRTGIGRLTAGGIVVAIRPQKPQTEPEVTAILTAADEQTLKQFVEAVQSEIRRAANAAGDKADGHKAPEAEVAAYRSYECHRIGKGHFSVVGRQFVASNTRAGLEAALDRLAGAAASKPFDPPESLRLVNGAGQPPMILATLNVKLLREDPKAKAPLKFPGNDPIPIVALGGYLDLFRRADFAAAGLFVDGPGYELKVRFPVGTDGAYAGLKGYFASETIESAPRLLRPADTIFTAGWFRDYHKLWEARRELFNPEVVQKLEADNAKAQSQGAKIGVADIVQLIGPHFRFVATRPQPEPVYKIKLDERLPAFALVVSVRDEAVFRQRVLSAADSLLWLGVSSANLGEIKPNEYRGAKINTLRFTEKPEITEPNKLVLYNFDPSYSLTRGELIIGSTSEIVRNLIDELDHQASAPESTAPRSERPTDQQRLSLGELSDFLKGYRQRLVRDAVLNQGLAPAEAEKEVDVLHQVLRRLGSVTAGSVIGADHFDFGVRLGPAEEKP
ncbi:MAG: hypothetical protein ACM3U2_18850 [Deltaproteobacteria bacterium]